MKFLLQCPKCRKTMLYQTQSQLLVNPKNRNKKRKRCVYCGRSFKVDSENIIKRIT